ncbi:MAG: asparaginase [Actinomycetota bacterium]|nr:asparaginase [Actinomycetota bacterium]
MTPHDGGAVSRLGPDELVASVPGLAELGVRLDLRDFRKLPSADLGFADVLDLLDEAGRTAADGVVVVQGTDTIEETAFLIDLLWPDDAPVVVTGAMRNPSLPGADGPANLLAAITVAVGAPFRGLGALVVMNDEVHAARHVSKRHSSSPAAFVSPNAGPLGRVVEGRLVLTASVPRRRMLERPAIVAARIPLIVSVLGDDGVLLDGLEQRCDGLVVAGFGVGHVPGRLAEQLGAIAARIPVVLASRTGSGPVLARTYGALGSESDLLRRGLISAGMLDPYKARVLLCVLLANGSDRDAIAGTFRAHAGG